MAKTIIKSIIKGIFSSLLLLFSIAFLPSIASLIFALLGVALLPIPPLERLINRLLPKKHILRGIGGVVIFVIACCIAPETETVPPAPPVSDVGSIQASTEAAVLPTQGQSPSTAEPTTEPVTPPTTEPITESITQPGTAPFTEPVTQPATEPFTQPVTQPVPPPSTEPVTQPVPPPFTEPVTQPTLPSTTEPVTQPVPPPATQPPTEPPTEFIPEPTVSTGTGSFEIHYIDVGQADAALVLCDGNAMLIDGGNAEDSSLMYTYLRNLGITQLDYVIGTHAHEDHIGGIAGALNYASVVKAYCPVTSYTTRAFNNFVRSVGNHGCSITVPYVGEEFYLGSAHCRVLGVNSTDDTNNSSIVLRITYGQTSFLFTGDAEREAENMILDRGWELQSDVLKVGHHGSASSTSYYWLRQVAPEYAVISVGKDNTYGHPTETVLSRLRDAEVTTFRTDLQGDIICTSDGQSLTFRVSKNADTDTLGGTSTQPEDSGETMHYVLNTNTMKFHYPSCSSAKKISSKNRQEYDGTREDLINQGYDPCGNCDP